jgi:carboxyl-terminal processing protease
MTLNKNFRRAARVSLVVLGAGSLVPDVGRSQSASIAGARSPANPVLSCSEVRARVGQFLDLHMAFKNFENQLSKRTFKRLFDFLDGGKYYFLEQDIEQLRVWEEKIDDLVSQADCRFLSEMYAVFLKRVKERNDVAMNLLAAPFRFDVEEDMLVDNKKVGWAKDSKELDERWRKRIKFQVLNMKDPDGEEKARERLKKRYEQARKALEDQTSDDIFNILINSVASSLDPHSTFMLPADQEDFNIRLGNSLEGIGATLREINGYVVVDALIPGGAAQRDARIRAGDKIIGVDSGDGSGLTDAIDMPLNKVVRLIRGKKGTTVKLLLLRKNESGTGEMERLTISIVRDAVKLTASSAKGGVLELDGKKLGVIKLPAFYTDFSCRNRFGQECRGASYDVQVELRKLQAQKIEGLILDLRSNGGGDLQESVRLTGMFIPEGTVVQTVDRRRQTRFQQDQDPAVQYAGPLAILVNKQSASASEIVAGAIQDYGRGLILGNSHTYGKGTVQVVQEVPGTNGRRSNGAIKVTQSKFYRPNGKSNQSKGIESDVVIPDLLEIYDISEKENEFALPWDIIKSSPDFKTLQDLHGIVPQLIDLSSKRVAKSKEFAELTQKMEKLKKERDKGTTSLKEEPKKDEKKQTKTEAERNKSMDENLVIRKEDIELYEAGRILGDAMEILKSRKNWTGQP